MMEIDWKRKLTSRKFWATVADFVGMLIIALGASENAAVQVTALIMAGGGVIAFIIGEGLADAAGARVPDIVPVYLDENGTPEEEPHD